MLRRETELAFRSAIVYSASMAAGEAFERRVLAMLQSDLIDGRLGLVPGCCQIFHHKGYYSPCRDSDIIFDISIELTLPSAAHDSPTEHEPYSLDLPALTRIPVPPKYSLLLLWECKDYGRSIPVKEVEAFYAKVQQVAGVNVKAGIVSSQAMQRGALRLASALGMSFVRLFPDGQREEALPALNPIAILLALAAATVERTIPNRVPETVKYPQFSESNVLDAFVQPDYQPDGRSCFAISNGCCFDSMTELLRHLTKAAATPSLAQLAQMLESHASSWPVVPRMLPLSDLCSIQDHWPGTLFSWLRSVQRKARTLFQRL